MVRALNSEVETVQLTHIMPSAAKQLFLEAHHGIFAAQTRKYSLCTWSTFMIY